MTLFSTCLLLLALIFSVQLEVKAEICTDSICTFHLYVTLAKTMTYRGPDNFLYPVTFVNGNAIVNTTKIPHSIPANDVIITDGVTRDVLVFNGTIPGPTLEVMESAQVNVIVHNGLKERAFSVHWHGIYQTDTYFMDGSAYVTQCPILPLQTFKYQFVATPHGTHWYHPHIESMRLDGAWGMLIVHRKPPTIPYFAISVADWSHIDYETWMLSDPLNCENAATASASDDSEGPIGPWSEFHNACGLSSLFDGLNRWQGAQTPLKEYVVKANETYRFRMVNTGVFVPFKISIDGHKLRIVASDGADIQPIVVDAFHITVSESIDFEIVTDQKPGRYWFRANTPCTGSDAKGILAYEEFDDTTSDPTSQSQNCTQDAPCVVFNCPFENYPSGTNMKCIPMGDAKSMLPHSQLQKTYGIDDSNVTELFLNFAMKGGPNVNGRRFMMPTREPLFQNPWRNSDCYGEPCLDSCECLCTDIINLPANSTIRLVVTSVVSNQNIPQAGYHPIHLHGHDFALLTQQFPPSNNSTGIPRGSNTDIECSKDFFCAHPSWAPGYQPQLNLDNPVLKDVVTLPVGGYVVIQFVTNNPGYWFFHCHNDIHMGDGMAVVFKVAPDDFPRLPKGFPTCAEFA